MKCKNSDVDISISLSLLSTITFNVAASYIIIIHMPRLIWTNLNDSICYSSFVIIYYIAISVCLFSSIPDGN